MSHKYKQSEVDRLLALRDKATPGTWKIYDSCSFTRFGTARHYEELIYAVKYPDGTMGIEGKKPDLVLAAEAPALADQLQAASDERNRFRKALEAIVKHQMIVGGRVSDMSMTRRIAEQALAGDAGNEAQP